ncbi:MAG: alpha-ribazole phosphatase [Bryobacteraceae bacterium]|jgi:alpha-ribazole phosphatase/probable phosphoglycerate mutase
MTAVWLIRHAEPDASVRGRCYGSLDTGLSPAGREQAARLAERLLAEPFASLCSSPRRRATETAEAIAAPHGLAITILPEFRELDFGDFEGLTYDDIATTHPDLYRKWMETPTLVQFPNGESFTQMRARVLSAYHALLAQHEGQTIAIVTHGGVVRIVLADALGVPGENVFRIAQRYGSLNLIRHLGEFPSVELVNA